MTRRPYRLPAPATSTGSRGNYDIIRIMKSKFWGSTNPAYYKTVNSINEWDANMARKTYRIEVKIDFNDDTRHEALLQVAKQYARDMLASAMLLQDGRKPSVALITDDTFVGNEEINILEEGENVHTPYNSP